MIRDALLNYRPAVPVLPGCFLLTFVSSRVLRRPFYDAVTLRNRVSCFLRFSVSKIFATFSCFSQSLSLSLGRWLLLIHRGEISFDHLDYFFSFAASARVRWRGQPACCLPARGGNACRFAPCAWLAPVSPASKAPLTPMGPAIPSREIKILRFSRAQEPLLG